MDEFWPPAAQAAGFRLGGTLDVRISEIEKQDDDMAGQIPDLARDAAFDMAA